MSTCSSMLLQCRLASLSHRTSPMIHRWCSTLPYARVIHNSSKTLTTSAALGTAAAPFLGNSSRLRRHAHTSSVLLHSPSPSSSSTTICKSYASPEAYDIAFSFRDFEAEAAFILETYQKYSTGPLKRFLDVGCGPARHSILLAQEAGAQCIGLDSSPQMIEYATKIAQEEGVGDKVVFLQGEMAEKDGFAERIPGGVVDIATIMLGTLSHCLDNGAALRCFANLAQCVRPGGLLLLELSHPSELFGGSFFAPEEFVDCWEACEDGSVEFAEKVESESENEEESEEESDSDDKGSDAVATLTTKQAKKQQQQQQQQQQEKSSKGFGGKSSSSDSLGPPPTLEESLRQEESEDEEEELNSEEEESNKGRRVLVEYGREGDDFNAATQILRRTVGLSLFDVDGRLVSSSVDVVPQRQFSLQEVDLLGRATGWSVVGTAGDVAPGVALDSDDAYRMVVVLKRD